MPPCQAYFSEYEKIGRTICTGYWFAGSGKVKKWCKNSKHDLSSHQYVRYPSVNCAALPNYWSELSRSVMRNGFNPAQITLAGTKFTRDKGTFSRWDEARLHRASEIFAYCKRRNTKVWCTQSTSRIRLLETHRNDHDQQVFREVLYFLCHGTTTYPKDRGAILHDVAQIYSWRKACKKPAKPNLQLTGLW